MLCNTNHFTRLFRAGRESVINSECDILSKLESEKGREVFRITTAGLAQADAAQGGLGQSVEQVDDIEHTEKPVVSRDSMGIHNVHGGVLDMLDLMFSKVLVLLVEFTGVFLHLVHLTESFHVLANVGCSIVTHELGRNTNFAHGLLYSSRSLPNMFHGDTIEHETGSMSKNFKVLTATMARDAIIMSRSL